MSREKRPPLPHVTFYTKLGCHLCEEARDMLEDLAAETPFDLTEIDIRSAPDTYELYRYRIPVIIVDEQPPIEGRIEFRDLARAIQHPEARDNAGREATRKENNRLWQ